jgi:hypothetical protein
MRGEVTAAIQIIYRNSFPKTLAPSGGEAVKPVKLSPDRDPVTSSDGIVTVIIKATNAQTAEKTLPNEEAVADFRLSTDALNYHRVEWRLREELGDVPVTVMQNVRTKLCNKRGYEAEEFDAALIATRERPRLPYGWTAMDLAQRRLASRPIRLLKPELEASRYAKGIIGLAIYLQEIQKEEPILLPVEQVREWLAAKKVVVAGTITKLVELGLLEMTKAEYNTGSAREFIFRGIEGKDYVVESREGKPRTLKAKPNDQAG